MEWAGVPSWTRHSLLCCRDGQRRRGGRQLCNDLTPSSRGTSPGGKRSLIRGGGGGGGQPPGSVMELDPRTPDVGRCSSLPPGMWPWRGRCVNRHYGWGITVCWGGWGYPPCRLMRTGSEWIRLCLPSLITWMWMCHNGIVRHSWGVASLRGEEVQSVWMVVLVWSEGRPLRSGVVLMDMQTLLGRLPLVWSPRPCRWVHVNASAGECECIRVHASAGQYRRVHVSAGECECRWLQVSAGDCRWVRVQVSTGDCRWVQVIASAGECEYRWMRVQVSSCECECRWVQVHASAGECECMWVQVHVSAKWVWVQVSASAGEFMWVRSHANASEGECKVSVGAGECECRWLRVWVSAGECECWWVQVCACVNLWLHWRMIKTTREMFELSEVLHFLHNEVLFDVMAEYLLTSQRISWRTVCFYDILSDVMTWLNE